MIVASLDASDTTESCRGNAGVEILAAALLNLMIRWFFTDRVDAVVISSYALGTESREAVLFR